MALAAQSGAPVTLPDSHAVAVLDDLTLIGPSEQVLQAFERMKQKASEYSLELQVAKCKAYLPPVTRTKLETNVTQTELYALL